MRRETAIVPASVKPNKRFQSLLTTDTHRQTHRVQGRINKTSELKLMRRETAIVPATVEPHKRFQSLLTTDTHRLQGGTKTQ